MFVSGKQFYKDTENLRSSENAMKIMQNFRNTIIGEILI